MRSSREAVDLQRLRGKGPLPGEVAGIVARYDGEIHFADHHLGRLLDVLRKKEMLAGSVIVFTSDHGETLGERHHPFDHGDRAYEEQIRVPLFVRVPGLAPQRVADDAHHIDLLATVADALGLRPPPHQGRSLLRPLAEPRLLVSYARSSPERVPHLRGPMLRGELVRTLRQGDLKIIEYPAKNEPMVELFDLRRDPSEVHDLASTAPAELKRMQELLHQTARENGGETRAQGPQLDARTRAALRSLGYLE